MTTKAGRTAALIHDAWTRGAALPGLPPDLAPASKAEGHAAQAALEALWARPRAGWKIAATSAAGQRHINVDGPLPGRLPADRLYGDGATVSLAGNRMRVAEPEFAFRLGADLPPRAAPYDVAEVMAVVSDLHLALELPDSRFEDFTAVGAAALIADDACARDLVLAPPVRADWRALDLAAHPVRAEVAGRFVRDGLGANVLGDPRFALTWLADELSVLGIGLRRGEVVITGTAAVPLEIQPGDRVTADFGPLGTVSAVLA